MPRPQVRRICEHLYMAVVCFILLWDVAYMTELPWTFAVREALPLAGCVLAFAAVQMGAGNRRVMWLPVGYLIWMMLRSRIAGSAVADSQFASLGNGAIAFLVVLPAAFVVEKSRFTAWMRVILALWTAAMTLLAATALWAMFTGHAVFSARGTWYIGLNRGDGRLYMMAYVTTAAVKMGLSVLLAAFSAVMNRRGRALYLLAAAVMLAALALTDCRTAFLATGAGLGAMAGVGILHAGKGRALTRWSAAACVTVAAAVGLYALLAGVMSLAGPHIPYELDNLTWLELPAHLLPGASAEAFDFAAVQHRAIDASNVFNGRQAAWEAALRLFETQPSLLLTGTTEFHARAALNAFADPNAGRTFYHAHNMALQILLCWGLPGLTLAAAFLGCWGRAACQMAKNLPRWAFFVPAPVGYVLLCDLVDCFTLLSAFSPMLLFGCLFAGWTLALGGKAVKR